jgi:hypothetical protein
MQNNATPEPQINESISEVIAPHIGIIFEETEVRNIKTNEPIKEENKVSGKEITPNNTK